MCENNLKNHNGFVALISVIIISFVLIGLTATLALHAYSARFDVLESEFRRVSLALAESCMNAALLKLSQDYNYAPAASGDTVAIGSNTCIISSVIYSPEANHQKTAVMVAK